LVDSWSHADVPFTHAAFSNLPDEVCGTSHVSQNFASFAIELSDPVKAACPSGRTRTIEGDTGPTGMMATIELSRFNIPVRLIEKKAEPETTSRAIGVQARTLEFLEQQGLSGSPPAC
jgi:hypothetical protein